MHPLIEEICRARDVQPHALGRWQQELRTTIQPMLDELETLKTSLAALNNAVELKPEVPEAVAAFVKRGPGRPRKHIEGAV